MDFILTSTLCAITGTMTVLLLYIYMYRVYHETYMGAWIIAWSSHFVRICLFESGLLDWKHNDTYCFFYQALSIFCCMMFLQGAYLSINKSISKIWYCSAIGAFALGVVFDTLQLSMLWRLVPIFWLGSAMLIYVGNIFINKLKVKGMGNYITGYTFILWGMITIIAPSYANDNYPQWLLLAGGIFRLVISSGILMVYFERTLHLLTAKEFYYKRMAENSVDVIYYYQLLPEPKVDYISPSVFRIIGYRPEEYYTNPYLFERSVHPDDLWMYKAYTNNPSWCIDVPIEYRVVHKNKSIIYIEQNFTPIFDSFGKIVARQGTLRDVTARNLVKLGEIKNNQLNVVGKMAVNLSHYIRNPLLKISCSLQMINNANNYKERCKIIMEEIDKVNHTIAEYVLLEKERKANLEKCFLNAVIFASLPILQQYACDHNVTIKTNLKDLPELYLDKYEISCLLLNLVRNSVEAMPSGGEIILHTSLNNDTVVLSISDQGNGVPCCILNDLGTPFITTKGQGRGLGLAICYRIATRNHADISVSTGKQGTTFSIHFNSLNFIA